MGNEPVQDTVGGWFTRTQHCWQWRLLFLAALMVLLDLAATPVGAALGHTNFLDAFIGCLMCPPWLLAWSPFLAAEMGFSDALLLLVVTYVPVVLMGLYVYRRYLIAGTVGVLVWIFAFFLPSFWP